MSNLKLTFLLTEILGRKFIAKSMFILYLFILFCKTDADFHQIAPFIL